MRTFDFSPLYRSTIGFDHLFDLLDRSARIEPMRAWPPYNIERMGEDQYRITMAVAGYSPDQIELVQQENVLLVTGRKPAEVESEQVLYRGITGGDFTQSFSLADHVKVSDASLDNGILSIDLAREVPEALKPRKIAIATGVGQDGPARENAKEIEHGPPRRRGAA